MLFDNHFHFDGELTLDGSVKYFDSFMKTHGIDKATVLAYCAWQEGEDQPHSNFKCIWLKKVMSPRIYAYMSLRHNFEKPYGANEYLHQLELGMEMGFDGIKSLDGKPDLRKRLGISLADSRFDLVFEKLEKTGFPMTMHVADPEYFWHCPNAYCNYCDGTFLTKSELYAEVDEILRKFPRLNITFAHFYFLSEDLDRAAKFLDDHPTVCFDITPGREMFLDFAKDLTHARQFFETYKQRLIWGSDVTNTMINNGYNNDVYTLLNGVLADGEPFYTIDDTFTPMGISSNALQFITYNNAHRLLGSAPKPINTNAVCRALEEFRKNVPLSPAHSEELAVIAAEFGA